MERWRSNSGVVLRKRRSFPVTGRKHLGTGKSHELQMVRAMLVALKETFSSRRDWHHLSFPILVRPPSKPCSLDKALERNSISRARRLHSSLWFDNRGLISWRGAFGLFFMPRDLFQFPDCCAAGEVSGLGAVVRRFSSFNLRSVRLQRKKRVITHITFPCSLHSLLKNPGAWGRIFCWEVSAALLCPSPPLSEAGRLLSSEMSSNCVDTLLFKGPPCSYSPF